MTRISPARVAAVVALNAVLAGPLDAQHSWAADSVRQPSAAAEGSKRGPDRVSFGTSVAFRSPAAGWLGRTPGRDVFVAAVRGSWKVTGREVGSSLSYFAELMPVAVVTSNPTAVLSVRDCVQRNPEWIGETAIPAIEYFERCTTRSANAAGAGITPIGVSARVTGASGLAFGTDLSVGAIMFDKAMPYPNTARLNYIISAGTSVDVPIRQRSLLTIGYQLQHLSNGGRAEFNPGILAHAIHLGWARRR